MMETQPKQYILNMSEAKITPSKFRTRRSYMGMSAGYRDPESGAECFIVAPNMGDLEEFWGRVTGEKINQSLVKDVVVSAAQNI